MLRALYDWTLALARHRHALPALAVISFAESSVFPIPPDVLMVPMILARRDRAWHIAGVALLSSVAGGLAGYLIGWGLFESVGRPVLDFYGRADAAEAFNARFNEWGAWAVLIAGVTPFPYKVITIMSGWTGLSLPVFIVSSLIARGLRFYVLAWLLWRYGPPIRDFIERRLALVFTLLMGLLLGGFLLLRAV